MEITDNSSEEFIKNLKVTGGFTVPANYFNELDERLQNIYAEPTFTLASNNGFNTPDAYFDTLQASILEKITNKQAKILPLYKTTAFKISIAIAAALLMVALLFLYEPKTPVQSAGNLATPALSEQEIIDHLSSVGYNDELLCDAGWCNELNKTDKKENNEIENYLQQHTEEDLFTNEL